MNTESNIGSGPVGMIPTFPWAVDAKQADGQNGKWGRSCLAPDLYRFPDDSWRDVWFRAGASLSKAGEYVRQERQVEVWSAGSMGGSIEESAVLDQWPAIARRLKQQFPISLGLVASRTDALGVVGSPGATVVIETPGGGSEGARMLMAAFWANNIGGCLARQEDGDRWGVVKILYTPNWYAASGDAGFGVNWADWTNDPGDENESKRLWCEYAFVALQKVLSDVHPLCIDSVFLDEYAATDRLSSMGSIELNAFCEIPLGDLAMEIGKRGAW